MTTEDQEKLVRAIMTILHNGSGSLMTGKDGVTRLVRHADNLALIVPPNLVEAMRNTGLIEAHPYNS